MLVMKETQVICRCDGYITDGNGDDIDNKHVLAMLTMKRRSEAEEPDGQTKERASGHFSTRAYDTQRKEQASSDWIHTHRFIRWFEASRLSNKHDEVHQKVVARTSVFPFQDGHATLRRTLATEQTH